MPGLIPTNSTRTPGSSRSRSRLSSDGGCFALTRAGAARTRFRTRFDLDCLAKMANWLFKEEPTHYSFDELVSDGATQWTGVRNPLAQKYLRSVRRGDSIFYYHTGDEKRIVGIARAA